MAKAASGRRPRISVSLAPEDLLALKKLASIKRRSESFMAAEAIRFWLGVQRSDHPELAGQALMNFDEEMKNGARDD